MYSECSMTSERIQPVDNHAPEGHSPPLKGVRVLEFGHFAVGPFTSMLLADWGADVVKIEPPGGEMLRNWPPLIGSAGHEFGMYFAAINRNKRSVVIDLKSASGLVQARRLAAAADIVIENYRPGVMDKLGLGYHDLVQLNPRLVYCSVSGYGQTGPDRDKGAFDIAIQGRSGIMSVTGDEDGPPAKCGVPLADYSTATYAALSCIVGLRRAETTGEPCRLDVPMLSCMLSLSVLQTSEYWGAGVLPRRLGTRHPMNAPYQAFQGSDGKWFILAAGTDHHWTRVCKVLGSSELLADARYGSPEGRADNQVELGKRLQALFLMQPAATWLDRFDQAEIPCAPILDYSEVLDSEHVKQIGLVHSMRIPDGTAVPTIGNPVTMSNFAFSITQQPPIAGAHGPDVQREWLERAS